MVTVESTVTSAIVSGPAVVRSKQVPAVAAFSRPRGWFYGLAFVVG